MENQTQLKAEEGKQEFFVTRTFNAPPPLVFRAFSEEKLFVQWFLPVEMNMNIEKMECNPGGSYYHTHPGPDGKLLGFKGVYHEVIPGELIIKTSEFFGLPYKLDPVLEFITFHELSENKTKLTIHAICPSVEYRDNMISAAMEPTIIKTHQQLDRLLEKLT